MAKLAKANPPRKSRSALSGRSPTEAVPSVEEFLGLQRQPRAAFLAGHVGELRDVILAARRSANLAAERRAYTSQRIVLPNGSIDAAVQPDDTIALPAWAFDIVCDSALDLFEAGHVPKRRRGKRHWYRQYRDSLINWHRYVLVRRAIDAGWTQSPDKRGNPTAFEMISRKLTGTSFGASAKAMEKSFRAVLGALKRGQEWRYYRSRSFVLYEQLLDPDADVVVRVAGIHGRTS